MQNGNTERHLLVREALRRSLPPGALDEEALERLATELAAVAVGITDGGEARLERIEGMLAVLWLNSQDRRCVFRDHLEEFHSLTGPHRRQGKDAEELGEFVAGARTLVVADPYFYAFTSKYWKSEEQYADALVALIPRGLEMLDVFHLPGPNTKIRRSVEAYASECGIRLRSYPTKEIHDRVWIRDKWKAKVVGTSLGGLGRKLAFILDLPEEDLEEFQKHLRQIRDSTRPLRQL